MISLAQSGVSGERSKSPCSFLRTRLHGSAASMRLVLCDKYMVLAGMLDVTGPPSTVEGRDGGGDEDPIPGGGG